VAGVKLNVSEGWRQLSLYGAPEIWKLALGGIELMEKLPTVLQPYAAITVNEYSPGAIAPDPEVCVGVKTTLGTVDQEIV